MPSKVAILEFDGTPQDSYNSALELIGGIDDLNTTEMTTVIKVGVFNHEAETHTTVEATEAIIKGFSKSPEIFIAESDNYRGKGSERLQIWKRLFSKRVAPFNLSEDTETRKVKIGGEDMNLSHKLFKPNAFVSTHILRSFERGSIIKNLFGLVPDSKKARFHKNLDKVLLDLYEAIGGIDLAVMDATYTYRGAGAMPHAGSDSSRYRVKTDTLLVGRDAVAVETVGAALAGLNPAEMPVLKEAAKRRLGETDLEKIEIVGSPFKSVEDKFTSAIATLEGSKKTR